jgi:allantoinase
MLCPIHPVTPPILRIRSEKVFTGGCCKPATVHIAQGRISAIDFDMSGGVDHELGDTVLMPGIIDSHVHINEPGRTAWEGFQTATSAAAKGGVSIVADMPLNAMPVTTTRDALSQKIAAAEGKLWVDCALWGGLVPGNIDQISGMVADGVAGFKSFLCHSGIDDFPAVDRADLQAAMPVLRGLGVPLLFHAELEADTPIDVSAHDVQDYLRWLHARPREWEDRAIAMVIDLVEETGCPAHIVHLSSASALPMLAKAKRQGLPITVETCPHYLCLVAEDIPMGATEYKCAPPIRGSDNRDALWAGLADGTIDQVVTDHSPCVPSLKLRDIGDFENAWGGIASLQLGLASVWTEAGRRGFNVADISRLMSRAPASLLGMAEHTGQIAVGYRADLMAWRPDASFDVSEAAMLQRHPLTPYLGNTLYGVVADTWVRGHHALRRGVPSATPHGSILIRKNNG